MTRTVPIDTGLNLPRLPAGHRLLGVVDAALGRSSAPPRDANPWTAGHFGLDRVGRWQSAPPEVQHTIVARCCRDTLREALHVERAGLAFTARMILLAESLDERLLYATFAGDEARHHAALAPWVADAPAEGPFPGLLADVIEGAGRGDLVVLIQVVLEGWGLVHYRALADGCQDPALADVFRTILKDEARHHGGGLAAEEGLSAAGVDALAALLDMVRAGPQAVVAAVEASLGPLDPVARAQVFVDLGGVAHAEARLAVLGGLLLRAGLEPVVATLTRRGHFTPLLPEAC